MKSPPLEWTLHIAFPLLVDYIRDRGEPDGDTLSEVIREAFRVHTPTGRAAWRVCLYGGARLLDRHICKEVTW
jgi:hypothetical protein